MSIRAPYRREDTAILHRGRECDSGESDHGRRSTRDAVLEDFGPLSNHSQDPAHILASQPALFPVPGLVCGISRSTSIALAPEVAPHDMLGYSVESSVKWSIGSSAAPVWNLRRSPRPDTFGNLLPDGFRIPTRVGNARHGVRYRFALGKLHRSGCKTYWEASDFKSMRGMAPLVTCGNVPSHFSIARS